jgi:uncharacterized protein
MGSRENKQTIIRVYEALAQGDGQPFLDCLRDDVEWTVLGTTSWSRVYRGKQSVLVDMLAPLRAALSRGARVIVDRVLAEDECVVMQGRGDNVTKRGERYDNDYCHVYDFVDGRVRKVVEYADTELMSRALGPRLPDRVAPAGE